ncbi:hypothetical protein EDB84DRAFT_1527723, partial [Lactarius hengduanensis]
MGAIGGASSDAGRKMDSHSDDQDGSRELRGAILTVEDSRPGPNTNDEDGDADGKSLDAGKTGSKTNVEGDGARFAVAAKGSSPRLQHDSPSDGRRGGSERAGAEVGVSDGDGFVGDDNDVGTSERAREADCRARSVGKSSGTSSVNEGASEGVCGRTGEVEAIEDMGSGSGRLSVAVRTGESGHSKSVGVVEDKGRGADSSSGSSSVIGRASEGADRRAGDDGMIGGVDADSGSG